MALFSTLRANQSLDGRSEGDTAGVSASSGTPQRWPVRKSEPSFESPCRGLLYGIEISVRPIVRIHGKQRRLGQESRPFPPVGLRRMHQERMT